MQPKTVEQLPCKLSVEETLLKSRQLAQLSKDVSVLEEAKKAEQARFKTEIDDKESAISRLVQEVHSGEELRPVECYERPRYADMMVDIIRTDLATVVRSRPMHPTERQTALDMGDLPPDPQPRPRRSKRHVEETTPEDAH